MKKGVGFYLKKSYNSIYKYHCRGGEMKISEDKMWEAWGRTNALYTAWCAAAGQNQYRVIVLYAIEAHAPITQKDIADYTGLSKQTVSTVTRALKAEGLVSLQAGESDRREKRCS